MLDRVFTELFSSGLAAPKITVVWHSGEPMTMPPRYYDQAIDRVLSMRDLHSVADVEITFDIQTNGVLINREWCELFRRRSDHLSVGVSCDGPAILHDRHRVRWSGRATHAQTLRGMQLLEAAGLKYKAIAVVTDHTLARPEEFFEFFFGRRQHLTGFHFNILAAATGPSPELSYSSSDRDRYYTFYRTLMELCRRRASDGSPFEILNFSQALARLAAADAREPALLAASAPLKALNVDTTGKVTTFYAGLSPDTLPHLYGDGAGLALGNILEESLVDMASSLKLHRIRSDFHRSASACRSTCGHFATCSGGFELTKVRRFDTYDAAETTECVIHVQALHDALIDDISVYLESLQQAAQ